MKTIMEIVRRTSLYFQPQIRTKILNEGWASFWHDRLFMNDDRIRGNEVNYARVNAGVTALSRLGINPYALGMRLYAYLEEAADKGKLSYDYQRLKDADQRRQYDRQTGAGKAFVFHVRENYSDFTFINDFIDQGFIDAHNLFVAGRRLNRQKGVWEYYVQSRKSEDYKKKLLDALYHPPVVSIVEEKMDNNILYLNHRYEGKPLVRDYIAGVLMGMEYLWGGPVKLETTEIMEERQPALDGQSMYVPLSVFYHTGEREPALRRVVYTMEKRKLSRTLL